MYLDKYNNVYFLSIVKKVNVVLFGVLSTIFINRLLGPSLKGEFEYINNILTILITFFNLGISLVLPNYARKKSEWTCSTFYMLSFVQFFVYVSICFAIWGIMNNHLYFLYGLVVAFGILSLQMLNCTMIYNFKATVIANCLGVIINAIILAFAFIINFANINLVFISLIFKDFICILLCIIPMRKEIKISRVKVSEWYCIIASGMVPMLTSLLSIMNYKIDVVELQWLGIETYGIGIYSVGLCFAEYALLLSDMFKDVLFNKNAQKDDIESTKFCLRSCSSLLIIVFLFMILLGRFVIYVLYGSAYISSYYITIIVILGVYSMMYFKLLGVLYIAQGKWWFYFFVLFGSVIINITANLILIPVWSIYGAAITSLLSYMFAGLVFIYRFSKDYKIKYRDIVLITKSDLVTLKNALYKRGKANE